MRPLLVTPFFGRQLPDCPQLRRFFLGCFAQTASSLSFSLLLAYALLYLLCSALLSFAGLGFLCFALPRSTTLHFALPRVVLPCLALLCSTSSFRFASLCFRGVFCFALRTRHRCLKRRDICPLSAAWVSAPCRRSSARATAAAVADPVSPGGGGWGLVQLNAEPRARKQLPARGRGILQTLLLATLSVH